MATPSFLRLSSASSYDSATRNIGSRQTNLSTLQENLTSGKRVVRASDDPTSASIAERALTRLSRIATDQRALESQRSAITQAESVLGDVTDALQRFRVLTVSAGSGTNTSTERKTIALEMQGLRDQIFSLANSEDANGLPLFSALGSALKPFVGPQASAPDYTFNGLPGQTTSTSLSIATTLDGDSAFMLAPKRDAAYNVGLNNGNVSLKTSAVSISDAALVNGSTYTISNIRLIPGSASGTNKASYDLAETLAGSSTPLPTVSISGPDYPSTGKSIPLTVPGLSITLTGTPAASDTVSITPNASLFSVLDNAINNIGAASNNNTAAQAVAQALHNIDIGMGRVSAARGQAGELMNRADRITDRQEKRSVQMESDRSQAEDLDMIKGLSDFQNQQSGFQAALQTYAQIQKLSLFNYIS